MNKLLILLAFALSASAGGWSTVVGMTMEKVKIDKEYVIDTNGYNPRVYEWTAANGMNCVTMFSSSDASSEPTLQCSFQNK